MARIQENNNSSFAHRAAAMRAVILALHMIAVAASRDKSARDRIHTNTQRLRAAVARSRRRVQDKVDPAVGDFKQKHAGLPDFGEHEVPAYCERTTWPAKPTGVNSFAGYQPLPARCRESELSYADTKSKGPNGAPSGECFQLDLRPPNASQPVLPTLFMPGFPKCASTWLFECMSRAYIPEMVCSRPTASAGESTWRLGHIADKLHRRFMQRRGERFDPHAWSKEGCRHRRFMLPGIACQVTGSCGLRKELFFYGAGYGDYFRVGMAGLHGPELPLDLFAKEERRPPEIKPKDWEYYRVKRFEQFCTNSK